MDGNSALVDKLLRVLRGRSLMSGAEIAAALGVSQPTLSRTVAAAQDRVCRLGQGRTTRYALPRNIAGLPSILPVFRVDEGGAVHQFGSLQCLAENRSWLIREEAGGELVSGLPAFAWDMCPQGYIGRGFANLHSDLPLPKRLNDWSDDHRLIALARRGEDCVGNVILGTESLDRFLATVPTPIGRDEYPHLARSSAMGQPGSSAGGEMPKFAVILEASHVLVKFANSDTSLASERWRDLLVCECVASEMIRATGIPTATTTIIDRQGNRFLEVQRFDRIGIRGRKGIISLSAFNIHYLGASDGWSNAVQSHLEQPLAKIAPDDLRRIRWLDTFGDLIGNTDRHFGNISFFTDHARVPTLELAPIYDMLPMVFAPAGLTVVDRPFTPQPAKALNLDVWRDAAFHALNYWNAVVERPELSGAFREICLRCRDTVATLISRSSV